MTLVALLDVGALGAALGPAPARRSGQPLGQQATVAAPLPPSPKQQRCRVDADADRVGQPAVAGGRRDLLLYRLVALWLADTSGHVCELLRPAAPRLPAFKLVPLLYQLAARLGRPGRLPVSAQLLEELLERCAAEHPHHTLPVMLVLKNALADSAGDAVPASNAAGKQRAAAVRRLSGRPAPVLRLAGLPATSDGTDAAPADRGARQPQALLALCHVDVLAARHVASAASRAGSDRHDHCPFCCLY